MTGRLLSEQLVGIGRMTGKQDNLLVLCKFLYGVGGSGLCIRLKINSNYSHRSRYSLRLMIEMF